MTDETLFQNEAELKVWEALCELQRERDEEINLVASRFAYDVDVLWKDSGVSEQRMNWIVNGGRSYRWFGRWIKVHYGETDVL